MSEVRIIQMTNILSHLSPEDIALAGDASVMESKNRIIQHMYELFGRLADGYREVTIQLPEAVKKLHPKISKGENYVGLPWVMLDYPRLFSATDIFAIRTLFWWGNYFSLQLLLKGQYMNQLNVEAIESYGDKTEWFFYIGDSIWQHQLQENDVVPLNRLAPEIIQQQAEENGFYKLVAKLPVAEWNNAEAFLVNKFARALQFCRW